MGYGNEMKTKETQADIGHTRAHSALVAEEKMKNQSSETGRLAGIQEGHPVLERRQEMGGGLLFL